MQAGQGRRFHEVLDDLASRSWLARSDLGYLVLGREPGMALLKDRRLAPRMRHLKPGAEPVFGTPTGIYTMRSLPVRFAPHEPG